MNKDYFSYLFIYLFGVFPILPFKAKGLSVAALLLISLFLCFKKINQKKPRANVLLINGALYILLLLSFLYSSNISVAFTRLETSLSILLIPIGFVLISKSCYFTKSLLEKEILLKKVFIYSNTILSILIFLISIDYGNLFRGKIKLNPFLQNLNDGFFWMEDHPIYLSIYLSVSILAILSVFNKIRPHWKFIYLLFLCIQFLVLLILARKGVIFSLLFLVILYCVVLAKNKIITIFFSMVFLIGLGYSAKRMLPDTYKRFSELTDTKSYKKIENFSSTSIRYGIYMCSIDKIKESFLFGYGIGDANNELLNCYEETSIVLTKGRFNSHNQYLGIMLSIGILGLFIFLSVIGYNIYNFYTSKDYFATIVILFFLLCMLTENILERQNGIIIFSLFLNYHAFKHTIRNDLK